MEITGQDRQDMETIAAFLPEHYAILFPNNNYGIRCYSPQGIGGKEVDTEDDEHWSYIMNGLKQKFGGRFLEVDHTTNYRHSDFTIYLRPANE